jgi:DNA-binding NarL/FixJ family response regulator
MSSAPERGRLEAESSSAAREGDIGVEWPTVLVIDDHRLFAEAMRQVLQANGLMVSDIASDAASGFHALERSPVDLVLLDLRLPDADGLRTGEKIIEKWPAMKVMVVSAPGDPQAVQRAIRSGLHGYVTKDASLTHIVESIKAVLGGQVVMPRKLASMVTDRPSDEEREAALRASQLTGRELEVLVLLADGLSSNDIAAELDISLDTVRTHVKNILAKLGVHSRLQAALFAFRHRLVDRRSDVKDSRLD